MLPPTALARSLLRPRLAAAAAGRHVLAAPRPPSGPCSRLWTSPNCTNHDASQLQPPTTTTTTTTTRRPFSTFSTGQARSNARDHDDAVTRSLLDELSLATNNDLEDARFELRFLVQHVLTPPTTDGTVPKDSDRPPAPSAHWLAPTISTMIPSQLAHLRTLVRARVHDHTPLQYLLGSVPFAPDLDLLVKPPILIPRWETEEWALRVADAWTTHSLQIIEDWCTGSGCIALLLKSCFGRTTRVTGFDLNPAAIDLARRNADRNALDVKFHVANVLTDLPRVPGVDLVVANPPYIAASEFAQLDPGVRDWEDRLALVGRGETGVEDYRQMVEIAHARLSSAWQDVRVPRIALEIGCGQGEMVKQMVEAWFEEVEVWQDLAGKDRCVVGYHRKPDAAKK